MSKLIHKLHQATIKGGGKRPLQKKYEDKVLARITALCMEICREAESDVRVLLIAKQCNINYIAADKNTLFKQKLSEAVSELPPNIKELILEFKNKLNNAEWQHTIFNSNYIKQGTTLVIREIEEKIAENILLN